MTRLPAFAGEPHVLIFMRHLGCLPCREHLRDVTERIDEIPAKVVCVTFTGPPLLDAFREELDLPFDLHADTDRELYRALGFGRGSFAAVWLNPKVWTSYAKLIARGRRPKPPQDDTMQLGGDAVTNTEGEVTWVYPSASPADRPSVDQLIAALA